MNNLKDKLFELSDEKYKKLYLKNGKKSCIKAENYIQ